MMLFVGILMFRCFGTQNYEKKVKSLSTLQIFNEKIFVFCEKELILH